MTNINPKMPKYQTIGEHFIALILAKEFLVGDTLPTEKELCTEFSISRHTAREALRHIQQTGLVERRQGSGTIVVRNTMPEQINQFVNSIDELLLYGNATQFKLSVSDMVPASEEVSALLECDQNAHCIHLGGVRIEPHDKKPVCYTNVYRLPHADAVDAGLKQPQKAVKTLIKALNVKNIAKVEQTIQACLMPDSLAEQLNADPLSAAMMITRRYFANDQKDIIVVSQSLFPAKRFSYSTVLHSSK